MSDKGHWVLTLRKDGKDWIFSSTFGRYRHSYLWNLAWCRERFDLKTIGPEGRNFFGVVNETGINQLKELGYKIEPAHVITEEQLQELSKSADSVIEAVSERMGVKDQS